MRPAITPWIVLAGVLWLSLFGSLRAAAHAVTTSAAPVSVVVTIAPLKGLVERLAPTGSTIRVLMPPGRSEHGYEFTPADLAALGRADVSIRVGLGLEPKVEEFVKKRPGKDRTDLSFAECLGIIGHDDHEGHDHAHDEHEHAIDPHLWLDPSLVEAFVPHMAKAVREASARKRPLTETETEALAAKEQQLIADIRAVDAAWRARLAPFKGRSIVTHHNAFPRPAKRYGLKVAAVIRGLENAEPKPSALDSVVKAIRSEGVHAVFVEPQFNAGLAERIAKAAGVKVARLDPLGDGDWFALMATNLESLATNLGDPTPEAPSKPGPESPPK